MKVSVRWRMCFEGNPPSPKRYFGFFSHFFREIPNTKNLFLEVSYMRKFLSGMSKKKLTYDEIAPLLSNLKDSPSKQMFLEYGKEIFDYCHRDVQLYLLSKIGITTSDLHRIFVGSNEVTGTSAS